MKASDFRFFTAWLGSGLLILFVILVVIPGRGAGWMVDDSLFLANAWNAIHGFGLDGMLPQEPVYLVNALFMKLGATEILQQRYTYYTLWGLGVWFLLSGIESERTNWLIPLGVAGAVCISFSSVLAMSCFFPLAAGSYFRATKALGWQKDVWLTLSGLFFALGAFMHAALAIAMFLTVLSIYLIDRSVWRSALAPVFLIGSIVLWGGYLHVLGVDRFFAQPAGHQTDLLHLFGNVTRIVWFFASAILAFIILAVAFRRKGEERFLWAHYGLSLLITAFYCFKFLGMHLLSAYPEFFVAHGFGSYTVDRLLNAPRLVVDAPGAIYYLLIFVICRCVAESDRWRLVSIWRHPVVCWNTLTEFLNADANRMRFFIASTGMCLMAAGYAAGSASSFAICLSAFSGPAFGIVFMVWRHLEKNRLNQFAVVLLGVWSCVFVLFAARMNLPTFEPIMHAPDRVTLSETPLKGLKESKRYQDAVDQLKAAYALNDCESKRLVLMDYVPTVHLILQHEVPNDYGVVRPGVYFPESKLMKELDSHVGWCVLDVTTDETRALMQSKDVRASVLSRVYEEHKASVALASPSRDIEPMVLYVK
jgi:hypothetical protein